jgi:hypothetical protein
VSSYSFLTSYPVHLCYFAYRYFFFRIKTFLVFVYRLLHSCLNRDLPIVGFSADWSGHGFGLKKEVKGVLLHVFWYKSEVNWLNY